MIASLFLEALPALWRRLCALAEQSAAYRLLRRLYHLLRGLLQESLLWALLTMQPRSASSGRLRSAVTRWLHAIGRRLHLAEALDGRRWKALDFAALSGAGVLLMYLCPAARWNNRYALAFALGLLLVLLLLLASNRRSLPSAREIGFGFLLFLTVSLNGIAAAQDVPEALRVFAFYLTAYLLALTLACGLSDRQKLQKFLGFVYLTVLCTGAYAIWQRIVGVPVNSSQTDLVANAGMPGRVYSTMENPNNFAELLVMLLPLAFAWTTMLPRQRTRLTATLLLSVPLAALLMTYSRSGWISFALAVLVMLFFCQKRMLPLLALAAVLALPLLPGTILRRILTIGSASDSSNRYRVYIWQGTLRLLRRFGLTGVGFGPGNFHPVYTLFCGGHAQEAQHAHMLYLELWAELGIGGLLAFLAFHFGLLRRAVLRKSRAKGGVRMTLIAAAAALTGISFSFAVEYVWFYPRDLFCYFLLAGVTLAAARLAETDSPQATIQQKQ